MKRFLPLGIFVALCVLLAFSVTRLHKEPAVSPLVGKPLPELTLQATSLRKITANRATIINVFASWCAPCAVEHSTLMQVKQSKLAPIIGIAWKNKPQEVQAWLEKRGNPYLRVLLDERGDTTIPLALTGVPETLIVNRQGTVVYHTNQPLTHEMWTQEMIPLLQRMGP